MITTGDARSAGPMELVLGLHLLHLRESRQYTLDQVAERAARWLAVTSGDLEAMEAGHGTALRGLLGNGQGPALAWAYGARQREADDWQHCLRPTGGDPRQYADDSGPGYAHRYQLLEQRAQRVLFTASLAGGLPSALFSAGMREAMAPPGVRRRALAGEPRRLGARQKPVQGLSGQDCALCELYRGPLLDAPLHDEQVWEWEAHAGRARAAVLLQRPRQPGADAVTLLISEWAVVELSRAEAGPGQLRHLLDLAQRGALSVRVLPFQTPAQLMVSQVLVVVDGMALLTVHGGRGVTYTPARQDDFDPHLGAALPCDGSLLMLRRGAAQALPRPW
ncbi:Scr1 family TA system antitoxin-like transcriptional regulator [Kitasatospora sp. NPDC088783]|uniref:Scr1 family TA system antitoxin-like transcriptional regulator n=1 Tax=Kitasatospora sp. NPDC088783 TaxID=3364077 RepID=UPI00382115CE